MASRKNKVIIAGLNECLVGIRDADRDTVYGNTYYRVESQNNANGVNTKDSYDAVLRKGSCRNDKAKYEGQEYRSTSFIVDIEELKYSFRIMYSYIPSSVVINKDSDIKSDEAVAYCLNKDEMIYPDFGCDKDPLALKTPDPIKRINGAIMDGCTLSYTTSGTSKSGYAIIIKYQPPAGEEYSTFRPKCREAVMNRIKDAGINPDDYYLYELDK